MTELALLRHGHTPWNREGRLQGRTDIPLDPEARATLAALRLPTPWDGAELWSSPLSRAIETAELVAGRSPRTDPALTEMNWGLWEGKKRLALVDDPEADYRDIDDWSWHYRPPQGESPAELRERLIPWAERLQNHSVAVCHIGVMRVFLAHATGWDFEGPAPFRIKRNRLYRLTIDGNSWSTSPDPIRLEERTT
ncbi:MAG: histidine phosphatase family protein [Sulfitobacter sp.]|nr:histidine phosphatase family protein [Sulfitobacter sp.]